MNSKQPDAQTGGMSLGDIYFTLFRHKWKILLFSASGFLAALALLIFHPPLYGSKTKLDVLYVVEGKFFNPPGNGANTVSLNEQGNGIIQTEMEIVQSLDVIMEAVQTIGPEKILAKAGGGSDTNAAAALIAKGLTAESAPGRPGSEVSSRCDARPTRCAPWRASRRPTPGLEVSRAPPGVCPVPPPPTSRICAPPQGSSSQCGRLDRGT